MISPALLITNLITVFLFRYKFFVYGVTIKNPPFFCRYVPLHVILVTPFPPFFAYTIFFDSLSISKLDLLGASD